jgi:hypothetical protein
MRRDTIAPKQPAPATPARRPRQGAPLPQAVRAPFEQRLGADFSAVRVHTDAAAGESALALGARAYAAGRDIVFAPGHYAPETSAGRELLAHELHHVAEDGGRQIGEHEPLQLDAPGSAAEQRADAAAKQVHATGVGAAPMPQHQAPRAPRHGPPVLHRSLLGAGIGGVLGGLAGGIGLGLLGGLLGPAGAVIGAVVGGIGGLIAGAVIGDRLSRRTRGLSGPEKTYLHDIYHDAVNYDAVTITRGSALAAGAARTTGNTINLQDEHFKGDTMELSDQGLLTLAHEMGHVWQYQNGGLAYIPSSLIPQLVAGLQGKSRNLAYDWRNAVRNHIDWADWNAEQQAECISDYNEALRRINAGQGLLADYATVTLAEPYIELVRQRVGAPGSSRRTPAPAAAGATP